MPDLVKIAFLNMVKYLFLFISGFVFSINTNFGHLHAEIISGSKEYDTLIVGCEYDYPPLCFENINGQADGFSVELFREAMKEMGVEVKFKLGPWNDLKNDLAENRIDALPLVGMTPDRKSTRLNSSHYS